MATESSKRNDALAPLIGEWNIAIVMSGEELPAVGRVTFEWMGARPSPWERWTVLSRRRPTGSR